MKRHFLILLSVCAFQLSMRASLAVDSPHGPMTLDCRDCHTTKGWSDLRPDPLFNHDSDSKFPLAGRHAAVACIACHTNLRFTEAAQNCIECHSDIHRGQFNNDCAACHTPHGWKDERHFALLHESTRFPLTGVHANISCQSCHVQGVYTGLSTECASCHREQFAATANPSHVAAGFSSDCAQCHSVAVKSWSASFSHAETFPLAGGHAVPLCAACHADETYQQTSAVCASCHDDDFIAAQNPTHEAPAFNLQCEQCHTIEGWRPAQFDHGLSNFPLTGAHVVQECATCHVGGQYTGTASTCFGCHDDDYASADNPQHSPGQFSTECLICHTADGWSPALFDHGGTNFPLTGAHTSQQCLSCHTDGQFADTPFDCYACHQADYEGASEPNHQQDGYPHHCEVCHSTNEWAEAQFNHDATEFPLTGAHLAARCAQCHVNEVYQGTPTDCYACHQADYEASSDPNHSQAGFPTTCVTCHTTANWESLFDHSATDFSLTGAHVTQACVACHADGVYNGRPTDCYSCHQADFDATSDPNHQAAGYPHACEVCHSTVNWEAQFNHDATEFPLTGAHVQTDCAQCHINNVYEGTPTDCYACHQADYDATNDPDHQAANFPPTCLTCHTTENWDSNFDHAATEFPLTGAHVETNCLECHVGGVYAGTPTDCWSCHEDDYNDADDPNHVAANFSHDCSECHNTSDWEDGQFNHNATGFPLTGSHVTQGCIECHVNNQYQGTPTDCWFCHQADYNSANSPDHNEGYPQSCQDCHTTSNWNSNFNHDSQHFPIYTGRHDNEWDLCIECHLGGNFATFSCIDCHEHDDPGDLADEHDEVEGYTYTPTSCYDCHEDGNGGPNFPRRKLPVQR